MKWTGTQGGADDAVVYVSQDVSLYTDHYFVCNAGEVDIEVTIDGQNYIRHPVETRVNNGTASTVTANDVAVASGEIGRIQGRFAKFRVLQKGGTASNAYGASY